MNALSQRQTPTRQFLPGRRGLSMVEVLVATTILSIGLLGYLSLVGISRDTSDKGNYYGIAARAAGTQVAALKGLAIQPNGYANLASQPASALYNVSGLPGGQMTVTITPLDNNAANVGITEITVTVTWNASNPQSPSTKGSFTQKTLVSNRR